ncbi:MAG TPA: SDR family oxidoreductase [Anaerolineae bacterium]|nr:SDR family oxidoreductase [Anaerolineae bacterium]HQI84265.1 SDR family oxidoreductase [Anaerolineae bacterium]
MKVLFIGGTGTISSACSRLAVERGFDLYLLNRGRTSTHPLPAGATVLTGDIRDPASARAALGHREFDVVVDWVAYTPDHVETDIALFSGRVGQYVFISTAAAYHKPVLSLPITESTPLHNPYWPYAQAKIACEARLLRAYHDEGFPVTIVRPSHTYDCTKLPLRGRWTVVDRMRRGLPVVVHGDGTSLWVLTHHRDFAKGFVGVLGRTQALGEAYHITSDEVLTWDQIFRIVGRAAGVHNPELVHIPSELFNAFDPDLGAGLLGDKTHSVIFDNTKIKRLVPDFAATIPFDRGAEEIIAWFEADPARQVIDEAHNRMLDMMIAAYRSAWPR